MTPLRSYQSTGIDAVFAELRAGNRSVCVVAPTGAGKTVILSEIVRRHRAHPRGGRVLVVVHRGELVTQTRAKLLAAGLERVGIIAARRDEDHEAPVLVASVQTLLARDELPDGVTLLVLDECHHYVTEEWRKIAARYLGVYVLGFTATPERGDGTPLGDIFTALVVIAQTPELIDLGHLCPIDVVAPDRETLDLCAEPIDAWRTHARGRPTVIFCGSVSDARQLAEQITAEGTTAAAVWGEMADDDRADALGRFALGELEVLTNVAAKLATLRHGGDRSKASIDALQTQSDAAQCRDGLKW